MPAGYGCNRCVQCLTESAHFSLQTLARRSGRSFVSFGHAGYCSMCGVCASAVYDIVPLLLVSFRFGLEDSSPKLRSFAGSLESAEGKLERIMVQASSLSAAMSEVCEK